eukprot:5855596-Prymnesium_polylepis.1
MQGVRQCSYCRTARCEYCGKNNDAATYRCMRFKFACKLHSVCCESLALSLATRRNRSRDAFATNMAPTARQQLVAVSLLAVGWLSWHPLAHPSAAPLESHAESHGASHSPPLPHPPGAFMQSHDPQALWKSSSTFTLLVPPSPPAPPSPPGTPPPHHHTRHHARQHHAKRRGIGRMRGAASQWRDPLPPEGHSTEAPLTDADTASQLPDPQAARLLEAWLKRMRTKRLES